MAFTQINVEDLKDNPFKLIGKDWMLVTAEHAGKTNMMTASWGGVGVMWNKPVAYIALRPQRFTKTLVDAEDTLSLAFFNERYRKELAYSGKASGRDEDKIAHCGFTVLHDGETPYFKEARLVLVCRKLFAQPYDERSFVDKALIPANYAKNDYHTLYILEIEKVLIQK